MAEKGRAYPMYRMIRFEMAVTSIPESASIRKQCASSFLIMVQIYEKRWKRMIITACQYSAERRTPWRLDRVYSAVVHLMIANHPSPQKKEEKKRSIYFKRRERGGGGGRASVLLVVTSHVP